jgi:hypothetical protein
MTAVNAKSPAIEAMSKAWDIIEPLMAGTAAMRDAKESLLPRFPSEDVVSWQTRIKQATLFPAFRRTVMVMSGKPFSKALVLSEDTPPEIEEWAKDIDCEGVNIHSFASEMMTETLASGLAGILVEAPKPVGTVTGRPPTKAEQMAAGVRPYWVRIKHRQILGWKTEKTNGRARLTQLRLAEAAEVDDGEFGTKTVQRVRVLTPGAYAIYEERDKIGTTEKDWVKVEEGQTSLSEIPFVPLYGFRKAFMEGESPLLDLAYMNVKHWQKQSDLDTIEHCACVPILLAAGFDEGDAIAVGASTAIKTSNADAKVEWVELQGASIGEAKRSMEALEDQMIQAGAELLVKKPGNRTATESSNDAEANKSDLQRITETFEDALDTALKFTAQYGGLPTSGCITLYKDFGASLLSDASAQLILSLQQGGLISKETAIRELQRRGLLSGDIDPEDELELVANEGTPLGDMRDPEDPNAEDETKEPPGQSDEVIS